MHSRRWRTDRLPACKSRNDRDRRIIGQGHVVGSRLETIARQYYLTLAIGGPVLLSEATSIETAAAFSNYGVQDPPAQAAATT